METHMSLEDQRLELERQKIKLEEKWRRNTYIWSILSGLLSAGVGVAVALIAAQARSSGPTGFETAASALGACRDSLARLETLTTLEGQTTENLGTAIRAHNEVCDGALASLEPGARK